MPSNVDGQAQWAEMYPRLVELCKNLNLSAGAIATILNDEFQLARPLTRHAVIGKVYRNKLRHSDVVRLKRPPPHKPEPPPPPELGLSIMDLARSHCRWPIAGTGAAMRYCGVNEASLPGVPYCKAHARMAYHGQR